MRTLTIVFAAVIMCTFSSCIKYYSCTCSHKLTNEQTIVTIRETSEERAQSSCKNADGRNTSMYNCEVK